VTGAIGEPSPAAIGDVERLCGEAAAVSVAVSMFQACSIVCSLAARGVLEPREVAAWAETFAGGQGHDGPPAVRAEIASALRGFAAVLRAMATKPPGSGELRQ
jgi:hypothetical protein